MNLEQIKSKQLESDIASLQGMHTFQKRPGNRPLKEQTRPADIASMSVTLSQAEEISEDLKNKLKNLFARQRKAFQHRRTSHTRVTVLVSPHPCAKTYV